MWTCPKCFQKFVNHNQSHSCLDRTVNDFLIGKSDHTVDLFWHFIKVYQKIGEFKLHPTKTRIGFAGKTRFGYVHRLGKNYIDVVLTFDKPYHDNLCFYRIGEVPGGKIYQHYLRILHKDDVNSEVKMYMNKALNTAGKTNTCRI